MTDEWHDLDAFEEHVNVALDRKDSAELARANGQPARARLETELSISSWDRAAAAWDRVMGSDAHPCDATVDRAARPAPPVAQCPVCAGWTRLCGDVLALHVAPGGAGYCSGSNVPAHQEAAA